MPGLAIDERTVVFGRVLPVPVSDRPTGEGRSGFIDIHIGIADREARILGAGRHQERVDETEIIFRAERMQLQKLAREVFVRARAGIGSIVEVIQHRRALGDRFQHRSEIAERVRADHIAVVVHEHGARIEIGRHDVEVVVPEADHHLMQLSFRIHRARQRGALRFPGRTHTNVVSGIGQDVIGPQLGETLAQRGVAGIGETGVECAVVDAGSIQLLVDEGRKPRRVVRTQRIEFGDRGGRGAERQMIECPHCERCALQRQQFRLRNVRRRLTGHARSACSRASSGDGQSGLGQTGRRRLEAQRTGKPITTGDYRMHRFAA